MKSIIEMVDALNYAYGLAYELEAFSASNNNELIEQVHTVCRIDSDTKCQEEDYLLLTPLKLAALYEVVRLVIINELNNDQSVGPRIIKKLVDFFEIKCLIRINTELAAGLEITYY